MLEQICKKENGNVAGKSETKISKSDKDKKQVREMETEQR